MMQLNQRDPELCVQALTSLLQLLQNLPPESLAREPPAMIEKMHDLLKRLRVEGTQGYECETGCKRRVSGNSMVSAQANACMISLAVANGVPELFFSSVCALLCETRQNAPINQVRLDASRSTMPSSQAATESSVMPKNFQKLALAVQQNVEQGRSAGCRHVVLEGFKHPSCNHVKKFRSMVEAANGERDYLRIRHRLSRKPHLFALSQSASGATGLSCLGRYALVKNGIVSVPAF